MNKVKKMLYSQKVAPYVFVLPFVISLLVFWLYPLISGIVMSFQDISFGGSQWVGLKHYQKLASDKFFKTAVFNSVEYMLLTLLLLIPIPMMLAVLMESRLTKAKGVWKVIMYIPALTSVVISGMLFRLMFSEGDNGQMNQLMHLLGNASIPWLKEKQGQSTSHIYENEELNRSSMPVRVYDSTLLSLVKELNATGLMDRNYVYTFSRNMLRTVQDEKRWIASAQLKNIEDVFAIMAKYVLGGMTRGNLWTDAIENGIFLEALLKIRELLEVHDRPLA